MFNMSKKISQLNTATTPIESDILAIVNSSETKKLTLGALLTVPHSTNLIYEDINFVMHKGLQDSGSKPDYDYTNVGLLFDPAATESVFITTKMPHSYAEGTNILPQVHWIQTASGVVVWQLQYKWTNRNDLVAGAFTTITASTTDYSWTSGSLHQITKFAALSGTGKTVGSFLQMILSRLGGDGSDNYAPDALTIQFSLRIQLDAMGTRQEYTK
jgi:hypothetical protein